MVFSNTLLISFSQTWQSWSTEDIKQLLLVIELITRTLVDDLFPDFVILFHYCFIIYLPSCVHGSSVLCCVGAAVCFWLGLDHICCWHGLWRCSSVDWPPAWRAQCVEPAGTDGPTLVQSQQPPGLPSTVWLPHPVAHGALLRPQRPGRHPWPPTGKNSIPVSTGRKNTGMGTERVLSLQWSATGPQWFSIPCSF